MDDEALVDIEARRVLADAQMHRGDPRGELFALQDALARGDASVAPHVEQLLHDRHDELYGPVLAPLVKHARNPDAPVTITWKHGLATRWHVARPMRPSEMHEMMDAPLAREMRSLELVGFERDETVLLFSSIRSLRGLALVELVVRSAAPIDTFGRALRSQPALRRLVAAMRGGSIGTLAAPALETLVVDEMDADIFDSALPALRAFEVARIPRALRFVDALASWPQLAKLRRVAIRRSQLGEAGLDRILANARAFAHLELLDLSHNGLDRARVRDARDAIPGLQIEPMSLGPG